MKLLIYGARTQTGQALIQLLRSRNLAFAAPQQLPDPEAADSLVQEIRDSGATQVFNLLFEPPFFLRWSGEAASPAGGTQEHDALGLTRALATASEDLNLPFIHLSSAAVFDGLKSHPYQEEDDPQPVSDAGKASLEAEQVVAASCRQHVILRTSMVFSRDRAAPFADCIRRVREAGGRLDVPALRFSPTPAGDVARVVLAIAMQLDCDANTWGMFHYCALQGISQARFIEDFFKAAAVRDDSLAGLAADLAIVGDKSKQKSRNIVLNSAKVMATFGIKQRSRKAAIDEVLDGLYPSADEDHSHPRRPGTIPPAGTGSTGAAGH